MKLPLEALKRLLPLILGTGAAAAGSLLTLHLDAQVGSNNPSTINGGAALNIPFQGNGNTLNIQSNTDNSQHHHNGPVFNGPVFNEPVFNGPVGRIGDSVIINDNSVRVTNNSLTQSYNFDVTTQEETQRTRVENFIGGTSSSSSTVIQQEAARFTSQETAINQLLVSFGRQQVNEINNELNMRLLYSLYQGDQILLVSPLSLLAQVAPLAPNSLETSFQAPDSSGSKELSESNHVLSAPSPSRQSEPEVVAAVPEPSTILGAVSSFFLFGCVIFLKRKKRKMETC